MGLATDEDEGAAAAHVLDADKDALKRILRHKLGGNPGSLMGRPQGRQQWFQHDRGKPKPGGGNWPTRENPACTVRVKSMGVPDFPAGNAGGDDDDSTAATAATVVMMAAAAAATTTTANDDSSATRTACGGRGEDEDEPPDAGADSDVDDGDWNYVREPWYEFVTRHLRKCGFT